MILGLAVVYVVAARMGLALHQVSNVTSLIWAPSAIVLAFALLYGRWVWPAVAIGTFITVWSNGYSVYASAWAAVANVLELVGAVFLLHRFARFRTALDRARDVIAFAGVAVVMSLLAASIGAMGFAFDSEVPMERIPALWATWWWGHLGGDLVVAPLILTWVDRRTVPHLDHEAPRRIEAVLLAFLLLLVSTLVVADLSPRWVEKHVSYYLIPLLLWAGMRFGSFGAALASVVVNVMLVVGTASGLRPDRALSDLQSLVAISSVTGLTLSALVRERARAVLRKMAIFHGALDAIITVDANDRVVELNLAAERLFGFSAEDLVGERLASRIVLPELRTAYREILDTYVYDTAKEGNRLRSLARRADGTIFPVEIALTRIAVDERVLVTGFVRDITKEQRAETVRRESHQLLARNFDRKTEELVHTNAELERRDLMLRRAEAMAHLGSFELDFEATKLVWSDELYRIHGHDAKSFSPSFDDFLAYIHPDDRLRVASVIAHALREHTPFTFEARIVRPDGTNRTLAAQGEVIVDSNGHAVRVVGCCQDVTARKVAETEIRESLREKEVLLREIHHRVKNNLQVVSSLLNLQVANETSESGRRGLIDSQSRVQSMALVHQLLYRSKDLSHIDLGEYLHALAGRLVQSYQLVPNRIQISIDAPSLKLELDRAIPCGLIVNELVTNSLLHAFPGGREGHVWLTVTEHAGQIVVEVRDNGVGLPPDMDLDKLRSFGLQIARTLTRQLGGTIDLDGANGTVARLAFPNPVEAHPAAHAEP